MYSDLASSLIETRFCVTADYGVFPNVTVSVQNRERTGSIGGPEKEILGYATLTKGAPGELDVYLQGVPVPAPYWVIGLGPVNDDGFYDYSIVSDPFEAFLFVLARNVTTFYNVYNSSVYTELLNMGFNTGLNNPVSTFQDGCTYWP
jgi:lipocalin